MAVAQDASGKAQARALAYAHGIGGTRGGVLATTFREETETDLFGEQAVLCGGATELIVRGFQTLVEAGYQPEVAYFECMHEMKLIVDLLHEGGLKKMHQFVSDTAKYGDLTRGPRIIDAHVRENMKQVLKEVQDGTFAKQWIEENKTGQKNYKRLMQEDLDQGIEKVGKELRGRMSWLQEWAREFKCRRRARSESKCPSRPSKYIWHEGKLVPWEQATVHVLSHALHYGSSVFEGIRVYKTPKGAAGFRLTDHVRRLYSSAKIYRIKIPFSLRRARRRVSRRRARERAVRRRVHSADRVSRLRRDGRGGQHRAAGQRLGRGLGMGLVSR